MATEFDPRMVIPDRAGFDPRMVITGDPGLPAAGPRGALGEIGTGIKRGALVGLPSLIGGAMKFVSEPGQAMFERGQGMVSSAEQRGTRADLSLQPEAHGTVVNALAAGGEMLAPSLAIPAAVGVGAAAAGASPFLATGAAALAGGALFGAEAGQQTLERGRAAGLDEASAREAARLNAATTVAAQAGMGMIGGQMLGTVGRTMLPFFKRESGELAARTLADLTGASGVIKPLAKSMAVGSAEAVGVNAAQAAASAGIEQSFGIPGATPGEAAADSVAPTLGLTALMGPLALVTRALNVRAAKTRTESLAHPETPADIRQQLADSYTERLMRADPLAAENFRRNAEVAIQHGDPLAVDSNLFTPDFVRPPAPPPFPGADTATPLLGRDPTAGNLVVFPDGTTGFASEIEQHIASLPPEQQIIERARLLNQGPQEVPQPTLRERIAQAPAPIADPRLAGERELQDLHAQVTRGLVEAGLETAKPLSREEFAALPENKKLKGQKLALAHRAYLQNPETQRELMRRDAEAFDAMEAAKAAEEAAAQQPRNPPPVDAPRPEAPPPNTIMAEAMQRAIKKRDEEQATAERDAQKARETDAIQNISRGEQLAADAEAGRVQADPNAPMAREAIESAWTAAMAANDMDAKAQSRVPFMKRLDAMGVFGMQTHAEQIAALESIASDKKVSQGARDRAAMLAAELKKDMPAAEKPPAAPDPAPAQPQAGERPTSTPVPADIPNVANVAQEAVQQALAGEPPVTAQVVLGKRPNIPLKAAPDNAAPSGKLEDAVASLPDNTARQQPDLKALDAAVEAAGKDTTKTVAERRQARMDALEARRAAIEAARGDAGVVQTKPKIPLGMPVTDMAEAIADRIAEVRAEFAQRIRNGEQLSPLEQERYEDLNAYAQTITRYQDGRAKPSDAQFVKDIGEFVNEASNPYKKSLRKLLPNGAADNPNEVSPALDAVTTLVRSAEGVMDYLATNGSEQWVKDLASKLKPFMGKTGIERTQLDQPVSARVGDVFKGTIVAEYDVRSDNISVYRASETNILHEAVHAATEKRLQQAETILRPKNQEEAKLKAAYVELSKVFNEAKELLGSQLQYGMTDMHEFVAELYSNDQFRKFLDGRGLMQRVWDGLRRLLGMQSGDGKLLQRAMDASEGFFSTERINEMMDSPDTAPQAMDVTLRRVMDAAERRAFSVDIGRVPTTALKSVLPLQTVSYIAERARSIPELVSSGFTRGLDGFRAAQQAHDVVLSRLNDVGAKYVIQVDRMLRGMDEMKARAVQTEMMTIGGEASRIGFDFRKNGRDNIAADKSIDPADKAYIDEIHRRWTQLQRQHPDAARLLEEGEKINRRSLIEKVATIAANLMDDRAGRARRLEAELMRMTPQDARRAELEAQVRLLTTESLMASRFAKGLDLMDRTLGQGANTDAGRYHDTATANLATRLHDTFAAARALPDGSPLKTAMNALEGMYAKESQHPYFSLGRDGDYFVKVGFKGIDAATNQRIQDALKGTNKVVGDLTRGDSHAFFRVRTLQEAEALGARLVKAGEGKVVDSAWGKVTERVADASSVSPALRTLLSQVDDMQLGNLSRDQADQVKQALTRNLLSMLPETAARNAQMGRRGIPGYDADFITRFSQRGVGAVHDTAGIYTSRAYMAAAEARKEAIEGLNRTGSADARVRAQLIDDEINKRYANMMKPLGRDYVANLTSLSHSFYLGLSPAFFIRTFAQPWQRGIPFVGSKFGFTSAMGELAGAQGTAMKLVANSLKAALTNDGAKGLLGSPLELDGLNLNPREMEFVREMHANGKLDLGESSQLVRMATQPGSNRKMQDAMRYAATTAQYAEMANRFALGLAAFRLAQKRPQLLAKGMTAEAYALQAVEMGMDDFSPSNTARAIGRHGWAGQMTPLFAQFQNYNLQTMQQIARTVGDGFFGQDKSPEGIQRAKEARREFAGLMATTATIAGGLGMPFANAFAGVYNSLMSDPDDPKDVRVAMRQWATSTFGQEVGTVLMKGLPSLLNMDTATLGQQGILPGSDFLADRTLWKERSEAQVRNALGPAVSLALDLPTAVSRMMDGYWMKGIEAALPVGLRSVLKTVNMATGEGFYTDSKGNPIPLKVGASDIAWRALGFQTESKSLQGDAQRDFIINQERLKHRRQVITDSFLKATRDPSQMPDAMSALQGFINKNPMQPITGQELRSAVSGFHTRFALGEASGTGIPITRRQFPVLLEDEEHAAMPTR